MARIDKKAKELYTKCVNDVAEKIVTTQKATPSKNVLEKEVEAKIKKIYKSIGYSCYGIQSKLGCPPGVSDLVMFLNGEVLFIEVKSPNAYKLKNHNLSEKQIKFLKEAGGYVATIINDELVMELVE